MQPMRIQPPHRRQAFTLVELLVVIAIIGVLIALLLPAVQKVREASRRIQCQNNLKQIALAYHNYEGTYLAFPPAYISDPTKPAGWGTYLLPYLELDNLYKQYTFGAPFYYTNLAFGIDNQTVVNTELKVFQCPMVPDRTDPYSYTFNFPPYPPLTWQASPSDYSPVIAVSQSLNSYLGLGYPPIQLNGAVQPDKGTPIAAISDGTSNTILTAEIAGKNWLWQAGQYTGQPLSGFFGGEGGWGDATSGASALYGSSADGTISPGSCGINCSNDFGLYSFHTMGANAAYADGSVHFLPASIDIHVLVALITLAGGETNTGGY
jgi:prepilin-type N-terminal cleavage/methylation domain-containing protein/prepilin-type processing-associated H-X9-DG protein